MSILPIFGILIGSVLLKTVTLPTIRTPTQKEATRECWRQRNLEELNQSERDEQTLILLQSLAKSRTCHSSPKICWRVQVVQKKRDKAKRAITPARKTEEGLANCVVDWEGMKPPPAKAAVAPSNWHPNMVILLRKLRIPSPRTGSDTWAGLAWFDVQFFFSFFHKKSVIKKIEFG